MNLVHIRRRRVSAKRQIPKASVNQWRYAWQMFEVAAQISNSLRDREDELIKKKKKRKKIGMSERKVLEQVGHQT